MDYRRRNYFNKLYNKPFYTGHPLFDHPRRRVATPSLCIAFALLYFAKKMLPFFLYPLLPSVRVFLTWFLPTLKNRGIPRPNLSCRYFLKMTYRSFVNKLSFDSPYVFSSRSPML